MKLDFLRSFYVVMSLLYFTINAFATDVSNQHEYKTGQQKRIVFGGDENYPPFLFRDDDGKPAGYHIDLIIAIADALGYQVEIRLDKWDDVMNGLLIEKTIDITSLAYQKRREKMVLFSIPHLIESSEIYIRKNTRGIESLDDLRDKEIILMRNATTHMNLVDNKFQAKYILLNSEPEALLLLAEGKHDAAIVGRYMGLSIVQRYSLSNLITVGEPLFPRNYVFATALDRQDLMEDINRGLRILKTDGRYNELNRKWFVTAQEQKHLLNKVIQYGMLIIVPLLIMASLSVVWNWSLNRKVNNKTSELQAELAERKRTEAALLESEAKFRKLSKEFKAILDGIPGILTLLDKELQVVWCNKMDLGNFTQEAVLPSERDTNIFINSLTMQKNQNPIMRSFENGREIDYLNTDDNGRTWEIRGFPMKNTQGLTTHLLVLANDITENIQLREEAIAASRLASLGALSAGVAHEINNPTGLILLYLPILKDFFKDALHLLDSDRRISHDEILGGLPYERAKKEIDKSLNGALECAKRIKHIVEDLKNLSRQDPIDMSETVDINSSVQTAVRLTASLIKKSTDNFEAIYDRGSLCIKGNLQRIEQVIINLIQNACFALEDKNERIFIRTRLDQRKEHIFIEVEDEGCGMDPDTLKRIADPFFTTRRESGGTGIGLSISAHIIEEHGGRLKFKSKLGRGTFAIIVLPIEKKS